MRVPRVTPRYWVKVNLESWRVAKYRFGERFSWGHFELEAFLKTSTRKCSAVLGPRSAEIRNWKSVAYTQHRNLKISEIIDRVKMK